MGVFMDSQEVARLKTALRINVKINMCLRQQWPPSIWFIINILYYSGAFPASPLLFLCGLNPQHRM